jgi:hypothetical protein
VDLLLLVARKVREKPDFTFSTDTIERLICCIAIPTVSDAANGQVAWGIGCHGVAASSGGFVGPMKPFARAGLTPARKP